MWDLIPVSVAFPRDSKSANNSFRIDLGAVAAMVITNEVASYANGKGLFIIAQSGDNLVILNDSKFQPRVW
jgi:hypothetical protein